MTTTDDNNIPKRATDPTVAPSTVVEYYRFMNEPLQYETETDEDYADRKQFMKAYKEEEERQKSEEFRKAFLPSPASTIFRR